jgi:hypothetical protein
MNRSPHRTLCKWLIALCPWVGLAFADTAERVHLDIPAQSLSSALSQFGRETGSEVAFAPDTVRGRESVALNGDYERNQALKLLLGPTGLRYRTSNDGIIVIESTSEPATAPRIHVASAASPPLDTVTVEARRQHEKLVQQVDAFVNGISVPSYDESLSSWQSAICPLVAGLPREMGEFVLRRISEVAKDTGAPLAKSPKCHANFLVVVTPEPDLLLEKWRSRDPRMFDERRGMGRIKRFLASQAPIKAWYNAGYDCPGGLSALAQMTTGTVGMGFYPDCSHLGGIGSRLSYESVRVLSSVIVVVDETQVRSLTIQQLADYVTMTGLAEVALTRDPGPVPTILRLFQHDENPVAGLSSWDLAYIKSLYHTPPSDRMQISEMETKLLNYVAD